MNSAADISLVIVAVSAVIGLLTYLRSGAWRSTDTTKAEAAGASSMAADLKTLKDQINGLPTAAGFAKHDERLRAVEQRIADLPTSQQIATLAGSIEVLKAQMKGGFDTIGAELRAQSQSTARLQHQVDRFEAHMIAGSASEAAAVAAAATKATKANAG